MKKSMSVFSLFAAGAMVLGGAGLSHADGLKVSGFAETHVALSDEAKDGLCANPAGVDNTTNCSELQFDASAEVDFEKTAGAVTVRVDLDFANGRKNNIVTENEPNGMQIEQAKFDWAIPAGSEFGLTFTAGIFNSPIGFEAQDSPDKLQYSNGQLFNLVPSNLAGVQISAGNDMVGGSLIFANDWNSPEPNSTGTATHGEENSFGATLAITPMPEVGLSIGYLDSAELPTEALLDIVLSGTVMPSPDLSLLYALEYVADEVNTGMGITLNAMHGKHGLTVRYDMVETDNQAAEPTTLTVAFLCSLEENLKTKLEWKQTDLDTAASSTDAVVLQFVMLF